MKVFIGLSAILLPLLCPARQPVKPLHIGEKVQGIALTHVYNYPRPSVPLSAFKGKLLILDFWSTWCGSCIEAIPKMEHLQQQFTGSLQIVLVNVYPHDEPAKVQAFFSKYTARTGTPVTLPYALQQQRLAPLFPFVSVPHYVWISQAGEVVATTSQTEVTPENIRLALAGGAAMLHNKTDQLSFNGSAPLLVQGNGGSDSAYLYRSLFTPYLQGITNMQGITKDDSGRITRFYMLNAAPAMLLRAAYPALMDVPGNRLSIQCRNADIYTSSATAGAALYTNARCYDLTVPPSGIDEVRGYMQQDMERYLGVTVMQEQRLMPCLVLTAAGAAAALHTQGGMAGLDDNPQSLRKYLSNQPFAELTRLLDGLPAMDTLPVIDKTNITGNIDIALPQNLYTLSLAEVQAFLLTNGIVAVVQPERVTVSIIKNK